MPNNLEVQTGNWDKPQIISFDSLFNTYSIEKAFEKEEVNRMDLVLSKWKSSASNHFSMQSHDRPIIASYITRHPIITRRTAHVELNETPDFIYKTYYPNSSNVHPMATTLRAPMASLIQEVIVQDNLCGMGVPKKGLFPLFAKDLIAGLNEKSINEAFVVCVEKIKAFNPKQTRELVKNLPRETQETLAEQCCKILMKTGLGDCTWENIQMHKDNRRLYILDTETLEYELFVDKFGTGFEGCAAAVNDKLLSSCAKVGLQWFEASSKVHKLEIFENKATSYLEKID